MRQRGIQEIERKVRVVSVFSNPLTPEHFPALSRPGEPRKGPGPLEVSSVSREPAAVFLSSGLVRMSLFLQD